MIFDKINFVLNILSSDIIVSDKQNLIKLFIVDSIADTQINKVEYSLSITEGRNTSTQIIANTELSKIGMFYEHTFTPTLSKESTLLLKVLITDINDNVYVLTENMKGVL